MERKKKWGLGILVGVIVLGIIAYFAMVRILNIGVTTRDRIRIENLNYIGQLLEVYYADHGRYPDDLPFGQSWQMSQIEKKDIPQDPLNKDLYIYKYSVSDDRSIYVLSARLENPKAAALDTDLDGRQEDVFSMINCDDPVYCVSRW